MSTLNHDTSVLVIGGGYSGALAANRLRKRPEVRVTLINPRPMFVERVRLHQLVAGTAPAIVDYRTILAPPVDLVVDTVTRIDPSGRGVLLASGRTLPYDRLIYAVGSTGEPPASVAGAREHALSVAEFESAQRVRAVLDVLPVDATIAVIGGGLTGIETAAELAEQGRSVTLVCAEGLSPYLSDRVRRHIARWMSRHGVLVLERQRVVEVRRTAVVLADGTVRASALTLWTAGFGVPTLAADSGLRTDAVGRLLTDETLTSLDDARIVATGDAAAPSGRPLRMSCQAAGPLGAQAADTVLSRIAGTEPKAIDLALTGACVSLGRRAAVRQFAHKDDVAMDGCLSGGLGVAYKELSTRVAVGKIRLEARRPGSVPWPRGGRRPETVDVGDVGGVRASGVAS
nr:FAD-dependent oxidoreductase [Microbacterium bovistercoris]